MSGRILPTLGSSEPWSSGVVNAWATCLLAPNPSAWTLDGTNTWVLRAPGSSDVIVVDPGPDDDTHLDAIVEAIGGSRHVATLLTHGHADHSAGARGFYERTGVPVRALDPQHRYGGSGLVDGDVITLGDAVIRVAHTPGHSADSLCFVIDEAGVVLTGDTVLGRGTSAIIWPEGRLDAYLASLDRMATEVAEFETLLPGHGPALPNPADVISAYIEHRHARLEEVRAAIAAGASSVGDVVRAVYADVPSAVLPAAELSVRAQVAYLRDEGALPNGWAD